MVKRRMSTFSRIVAFITAMAMAMLVVTVAHRAVISAEAGMPPEHTYSDGGKAEPYSDIMALADGDTATDVNVNEEDCIRVQKSEIYLNGAVLQPNTNIGDNQELKMELEWYIPADKDGDFSGKTFVWDITDELHGVTLDNQTYNVRENGKIIATYRIGSENGRTILYITPKQGFDGNHFNKRGSITLSGITSVDKAAGDNEGDDPYIGFFDKTVNVNIPKADVYTQKSAGMLRKGDDGRYYQEFTVYVVNNGVETADSNRTVLVDKPGTAFLGTPRITDAYYGGDANNKNNSVKFTDTDTADGFEIAVGELSGKNSVTVKYEMEVDISKVLSASADELASVASNEVLVKENPPEDRSPQTAVVDIAKLNPSINKYGTYDYDSDTITWVVTVSPNYYSESDFSVNDTIVVDSTYNKQEFVTPLPGGVTPNGGTITIPKSAFTKSGDNYVYEYKTRVPEEVNKEFGAKKFKNDAEFTLNGEKYTCSGTVDKKAGKFMTKKFLQLDGNVLMWEVDITVPENATYIDIRDRKMDSIYAGNHGTSNMTRYSSVTLSGVDAFGKPKSVEHTIVDGVAWNEQPTDKSFWDIYPSTDDLNIQIKDQDFLTANAGRKITVKYGIELLNNYDINSLSWFKNHVNCSVTHNGTTSADSADAEYNADVSVTKSCSDDKLNEWYEPILVKNADGSTDFDSINKLNSINRNNKTWKIFASFPKGLELGDTITFHDQMEGDHSDSYLYSGQVIGKDVMAVGLSSNAWGAGYSEIGNGDGNVVNLNARTDGSMILTVQINNIDTLDALNGGELLTFMYHTVMSDEAYTLLNSGDSNWNVTNVVNVNVNGGTEYTAEADVPLSPTSKIFQKIQSIVKDEDDSTLDIGANYTLEINKDGLRLGASDAKFTVTDYIGANLSLDEESIVVKKNGNVDESIVPDYNKGNKILTFSNLENSTHYTITYSAVVTKHLGKDESISSNELQERYGNKAALTFEGSDGNEISISDSVHLNNVKASADISSDPGKLKLNCIKKWEGDGTIPKSIILSVVGVPEDSDGNIPSGFDIDKEPDFYVIEGTGNEWTDEIELPAYFSDAHKYAYKYTIEEIRTEPNYTVSYDKQEIDVSKLTDMGGFMFEDSITITNTYTKPEPEKIDITVNKIWLNDDLPELGDDNPMKNRGSVTLELYRDDDEESPIDSVTLNGVGDSADLNEGDGGGWSHKFTGLDKDDGTGHNYVYTVREPNVPENYESKVTPANGISKAGGTINVTNTYHDPDEPETVDITVVKKWVGDDLPNLEGGNPKDSREAVTINIYRDGVQCETVTLNSSNATAVDEWSATVPGLPKEGTNADGKYTYVYTVKEVGAGDKYAADPIITEVDGTFTVKNVYQREKINITITKQWDDTNNPNVSDDKSATIGIYRGISEDRCNDLVGSVVLNGNESKQLNDLDKYDDTGKLYFYKAMETPIPANYKLSVTPSSISGSSGEFIVVNTYDDTEESSSSSITSDESDESKPNESDESKPSETEPPIPSESESVIPSESETQIPSESETQTEPEISDTPIEPGTSDTPYYSDTPYIPTAPTVPEIPTGPYYPFVPPFTPIRTTVSVAEPIVTAAVREEVLEDEPVEYEDVSAEAGIYEDIDEAVKKDTGMIIILMVIIIAGTSILIYRSKTVDADKKYRM